MLEIQTDGTPIATAAPESNPRTPLSTRRRVMFMARLASKWALRQGGKPVVPVHENAILPRLFLTFRGCRGLTPPNHRKDVLFDPPPGPSRPEVNARQRDAPSGAKVFGISSPSPRACGQRVGVTGSYSLRYPLTRIAKGDPTSPRKRGEVKKDNGIVRQSV